MWRQQLTAVELACLVVACGTWSDDAPAQQVRAANADQADFWPVRGNVYVLSGLDGDSDVNIAASVGPDGVLFVDTGTAATSDAVTAALARLEERLAFPRGDSIDDGVAGASTRLPSDARALPKPVRYVINTSARLDHSGANAALAESRGGGGEAVVIAHENVLIRLVSGEAPFERLPTETIGAGEHVLGNAFNGDRIQLTHVPAAVTDGDTIVHFRGADVICTGDVFSMETFPVIDVDSGGSIDGVIRALNAVLRLAMPGDRGEGGTLIVPGHGRLADSADVGYYRDMLTIIRDQVQNGIDAGMTLEQIRTLRPTLGFEGRYGAERDGWTADSFLEAVYRSLREVSP